MIDFFKILFRVTAFTAGLTVLLSGVAEYFGVVLKMGRLNLNMVSLPAGTVLTFPEDALLRDVIEPELIDLQALWLRTLQHEYFPKMILFTVVAIISTEIARRGKLAVLQQQAETAKTARLATELNLASDIQINMLPNLFPAFPDRKEFDIYASMIPAKEVGGDFYDFYMIDEDHLAILIADVSGKGIPAAMFMMASKIIINNVSKLGSMDPAEILTVSNRQIVSNNPAEMFVTVWLGIVDIRTGVLTAANAGHEYPCLKRGEDGFVLYKDKHGFVLGGFEDTQYQSYEIRLSPGDAVFVYTDGVTEAVNAAEEMYGTDRLLKTLNEISWRSAKEIRDGVTASVDAFVAGAPQFDDTTMLSFIYWGVQ